MKLYEISDEIENLERLFREQIDEETGEIQEENVLATLETDILSILKTKSEDIVKLVKNNESDEKSIEEEIVRLNTLLAKRKRNKDNFLNYVKVQMVKMGYKKIETNLGNIVVAESTTTEIFDENLIPEKYKTKEVKEVVKISKNDIKKDIKNGLEVTGARLIQNDNIKIK